MFQGSMVALVTPMREDGSVDENSLRNLRTDDIDLYMIHHSKPDRPIKD